MSLQPLLHQWEQSPVRRCIWVHTPRSHKSRPHPHRSDQNHSRNEFLQSIRGYLQDRFQPGASFRQQRIRSTRIVEDCAPPPAKVFDLDWTARPYRDKELGPRFNVDASENLLVFICDPVVSSFITVLRVDLSSVSEVVLGVLNPPFLSLRILGAMG